MQYKKTILFVDDMFKEERWKRDFENLFEINNYFLIIFSGGYDAVKELGQGLEYDLGITDLLLPDMDGYEVVEHAKKIHPNTPWFAYTIFPFPYPLIVRSIQKPQRPSYLIKIIDDFFKKQ